MSTPDPNSPVPPRVEVPEARDLTILAVTRQNFGDHAEMVTRPVRYLPGEDLEALVLRAFPGLDRPYGRHDEADHLVIRVTPGVRESTWAGDLFAHWRSPATTRAAADLPPF